MFDWLRTFRQSSEERQRERLNAYLDNALSPRDRQALEQELSRNEALQAELASLRAIKNAVSQLPRVPVPRSFVLSPALVSQPVASARSPRYPALRLATVLTAFLLVVLLLFDFVPQVGQSADVANDVAYYEAYGDDEAAAGNAAANSDNERADDMAESAPMLAEAEADTATAEESASEPAGEDAAAPAMQDTAGEIAQTTIPAPTLESATPPTATLTIPTETPTPTPTVTATPTMTPTPAVPVSPPAPPPSPLRLAQIGLAVLFLLFLFFSLRLRRGRRP